MPRHEIYKSKLKALAKLIIPTLMAALLIAFYQHDEEIVTNPVAWLWVGAIGIITHWAIGDFRQQSAHLVFDGDGIDCGSTLYWCDIQQLKLIEKWYGGYRTRQLVLETADRGDVWIDVSDLTVSPKEVFEMVNRCWVENRDRIPVGPPSATPPPSTVPEPEIPPGKLACPNCGAAVDPEDCECSRCYERLI